MEEFEIKDMLKRKEKLEDEKMNMEFDYAEIIAELDHINKGLKNEI